VLAVPPSAPSDRRWSPDEVRSRLERSGGPLIAVEDFADAVAEAGRRAGGGTVVVTGSVHTVGGAMAVLGVDALA
jgi:hypothetical protein